MNIIKNANNIVKLFKKVGYTVDAYEQDGWPYLRITTKYPDMPDIHVSTLKSGNSGSVIFQFECDLTFPTLSTDLEFDDPDYAERVMYKWYQVTKAVTELHTWVAEIDE